jgi:hypothetical protein
VLRLILTCILALAIGGLLPAAAMPAERQNTDASGRLLRDRPDGAVIRLAVVSPTILRHPDGFAGTAAGVSRGVLTASSTTPGFGWPELTLGLGLGAMLALAAAGVAVKWSSRPVHS